MSSSPTIAELSPVSERPAARRAWPKLEELALLLFFFVLTYDNLNLIGAASGGAQKHLTIAKLATMVAVGAWVFRGLLTKDPRLLGILIGNPSSLLIWAFLGISVLSNINVSHTDAVYGAPGPWALVARRVNLIGLYCATIAIIRSRRMLTCVVLAYVLGGLVTCYAGFYEMYYAEMFLDEIPGGRTELARVATGEVRVQGLETDVDLQATFLLLGIAMLPFLWHCARRWGKVAVLLLGMVYLINIIATGAKGGWIGVVLVLFVHLILVKDPRKWKWAAAATLCGVVTFTALTFNSNIVTIDKLLRRTEKHADTLRVGLSRMSWAMVKDHPIIGGGTGAFANEYLRYFPKVDAHVPNLPYPQLNGYLQVWGENGTVGLAILLLLCGSVFAELFGALGRATDSRTRMLGIGIMAVYLSVLWVIVVFPVMDGKYMWLGLGLAVAYSNLPELRRRESRSLGAFRVENVA